MTKCEFDPTDGESASLVYGGVVSRVASYVRLSVHFLEGMKTVDNGFLASVFALRILAEAVPDAARVAISRSEVEYWQETFIRWLEKKRIPKSLNREAMIERAKMEFSILKTISVPTPDSMWQRSLQRDILRDAQEKALRRSAPPEKFAEDVSSEWRPCKLVNHPTKSGTGSHSLVFTEFSKVDAEFKKAGTENDGYRWSDLLKGCVQELKSDLLTGVEFDPESSMLSIVSSDLSKLREIKEVIRELLDNRKVLSEALARMNRQK